MKLIGLMAVVLLNMWADDGKVLFDKYCLSCHTPFVPMLKLKENFADHNNTLLKLKAPTLNQLSYRLKQRIGDPKGDKEIHRMEVIAFMSSYVMYPDRDKSLCLDEVMASFNTMPSLKGRVSEEELEEIGAYLYDFDEKVVKQKGVKFEGFEKALQRAKKEDKIIMIEAMSPTCHFCKKMAREVLIDTEVVQAIEKDFIPVSIDISSHALPLGLKAALTPSFIFIDKYGNILGNIPGAWGKQDFLALLKEAKEEAKNKKAKQ